MSTIQKSRPNLSCKATIRENRNFVLAYIVGFFCISMLSHKEMRIPSVHSLYLQSYRHIARKTAPKERRVNFFLPWSKKRRATLSIRNILNFNLYSAVSAGLLILIIVVYISLHSLIGNFLYLTADSQALFRSDSNCLLI